MKKLRFNSRIAEVVAVSKRMIGAFEKTSLSSDENLNEMFEQLQDSYDRLATAANPQKALSVLDAKDVLRDEKVRNFYYFTLGQTHSLKQEVKEAALKVVEVFDKYGLEMNRENYAVQSGQLTSMFKDYEQPEMQAYIAAVSECTQHLEDLKVAQNDFEASRIAYEESKAAKGKRDKSSAIKREVLDVINVRIVNYLISMEGSKNQQYPDFASTIAQIIATSNDVVDQRQNKVEVVDQ